MVGAWIGRIAESCDDDITACPPWLNAVVSGRRAPGVQVAHMRIAAHQRAARSQPCWCRQGGWTAPMLCSMSSAACRTLRWRGPLSHLVSTRAARRPHGRAQEIYSCFSIVATRAAKEHIIASERPRHAPPFLLILL